MGPHQPSLLGKGPVGWSGAPTRFELLSSSDEQALVLGSQGVFQGQPRKGIVPRAAATPGSGYHLAPLLLTLVTLASHHRCAFLGWWGQFSCLAFSVLTLSETWFPPVNTLGSSSQGPGHFLPQRPSGLLFHHLHSASLSLKSLPSDLTVSYFFVHSFFNLSIHSSI